MGSKLTRLANELQARLEQLGREASGAEVAFDWSARENELVVRIRPTTPSADKAVLDVAVGGEDTVVLTLGCFGLVELVTDDPVALADEVHEFAKAVLEGRVTELLVTVAGRPVSSMLQVNFSDGARSYHHARFRLGHRCRRVINYVSY